MHLRYEKAVTNLSPLFAIRSGFRAGAYGDRIALRMNACYKTIAMVLSFLLALGQAGGVLGHTAVGSLGKKKSAADVYSVTCSNEEGGDTATFRLAARVRDERPRRKPRLSVMIAKGGAAAQATDKNGDGNRRPSPWAYVDGGNGVYRMIVTKSARGVERFSVEFHCQGPSSSGYVHTGSSMVITQNQ